MMRVLWRAYEIAAHSREDSHESAETGPLVLSGPGHRARAKYLAGYYLRRRARITA